MDNNKKQQNFTRPNNTKQNLSGDFSSQRKSTDLQPSKPLPRNSRRREQSVAPSQQQPRSNNSKQQSQRSNNFDKRPRPRGSFGGCGNAASYNGTACTSNDIVASGTGLGSPDSANGSENGSLAKTNGQQLKHELNSVYSHGSKKQNLNYLLNFSYTPREFAADHHVGINVFGRGNGSGGGLQRGKKQKYNKEQFMQANFQFVVKSSAKPKLTQSPDTLIDWDMIEQINIQTTEEPQCPICLYPPIAAKLTRCGHAYCWPCILHYLAISGDKTWRKCPICYEAVHTADLKSTSILQQRPVNVDSEITFRLMRREKGSMFIEHFKSSAQPAVKRYPQVGRGSDIETNVYSKFLIARRADILEIIERERQELIADEDSTSPDFVYVQQALDLLRERRDKLGDFKREDEIEDQQTQQLVKINIEATLNLNTERQTIIKKEEEEEKETENLTKENASKLCVVEEAAEAQPSPPITINNNNNTKFYYFYQSVDGQNIFLHPLNVKMLQMCYDTLDHAPIIISGRILQKEHHSMDEDHRRKFTCLGHLPLTCQFAVVEVDLQPPVVPRDILNLFKDELTARKRERQRRDREERKREKHINEINDRQMGKLIASTANINISSSHEFPMCGSEDNINYQQPNVSPPIDVASNHASYSEIAVGVSPTSSGYQELPTWGKTYNQASNSRVRTTSEVDVGLTGTNLSDVLAEAFSQKKQNNTTQQHAGGGSVSSGNKKNKKAKKMLPLFSTGMNYNGN